jgi:hypothetical protein
MAMFGKSKKSILKKYLVSKKYSTPSSMPQTPKELTDRSKYSNKSIIPTSSNYMRLSRHKIIRMFI